MHGVASVAAIAAATARSVSLAAAPRPTLLHPMKCLILLALFALATAKVINLNDCGIVVNGISHEQEVLRENIDKPYQLTMDFNNNVLYFSHAAKGGKAFTLSYINLKTNDFGEVTGVNSGFASAVDDQSHSVYFGGRDGLYKLNTDTKTAQNLDVTNKDIWQMFYKDGVYFSTYPDEQVYLYKNGKVNKVSEIGDTRAMLLGVDNKQNFVFTNSSGLFHYAKKDGVTTHIDDHTLNGISSDISGNLFFSSPTGIYSFNDQTKEVKRLANINNIYGVAVESDGSFIYASENSVIRLKSTGKDCISSVDLDVKEY